MAKSLSDPEILVLGEHPACYLAAALLCVQSSIKVTHATLPDETAPDRLVLLNPEFFELHNLLKPLQRKLSLSPIYGLSFLADSPSTHSEFHQKSTAAFVTSYKSLRQSLVELAQKKGARLISPKQIQIQRLDEAGLEISIGNATVHPKALVLGTQLSATQQKLIGLPESWGLGVLHRYTFIKLPSSAVVLPRRPTLPMSLDLQGRLCWAWLLPGPSSVQLAVEQPLETVSQVLPGDLLQHWASVLHGHGILKKISLHLDSAQSLDLPLAGALAHEGVANRTLLVGPAGGFYSACAEDIYPNCWSAVHAAQVLTQSLKEPHLQDAIQAYRHQWRTTLGNYLRGPQQNLRFLLPLIYRNPIMASRLGQSILTGQPIVQ